MPLVPLHLDTSPEIERLQIERWRQMAPAERAAIVSGLTQAVSDLALAGIRLRHPLAPHVSSSSGLALITLGPDLARRAYPRDHRDGSDVTVPVDPIAVRSP